jgi:hypothetical protein
VAAILHSALAAFFRRLGRLPRRLLYHVGSEPGDNEPAVRYHQIEGFLAEQSGVHIRDDADNVFISHATTKDEPCTYCVRFYKTCVRLRCAIRGRANL